MLLLFIVAFFLRDKVSLYFLLALEFPACILMFIAGWMGGTLVHRNLIGVDMRYAHAGKWKEQHFNKGSGLVAVANTDELKTNQMKLLHINGKRIALARTEISYVAFDDRCSHRGGSLASGTMICSTVQCPWHGSQFDVEDGEVKAGPAKERINVYKVFEKDGKVYLNFD
jgi:nitrite reductase/ring-hydroxylating ferredoxin subunit